MVKKLFKHEISYYVRSMLPIYSILLVIAAVSRVIQFFEADNTLYNTLNIISILTYIVGVVATFGMTTVFTIIRYYRNLFTSEGYLSFTLPVTPTQHILSKLATAVITHIASLIVVLTSVCIITAGDVFTEVVKAINYLFDQLPALFTQEFVKTTAAQWQANLRLFIVELVVMMLAMIIYLMLLYYACITVGQMFNKNRIIAAVGVYFGYYMVTQAIGTVLVIVSQFLPWERFSEIFHAAPFGTIHTIVIGYVLLELALATGLFFVSRAIVRRKLNLE